MNKQIYWVALATQTSVGGATLRRLLRHFASLEAIFHASEADLRVVKGVGVVTAADIAGADFEQAKADMARYKAAGVVFIPFDDLAQYPTNLLFITDCPSGLFVRGTLTATDTQAVAIIGTRKPSSKRRKLAHRLGYAMASHGLTVVSGLAFGIDAAAHQGALEAQGRTLAALGCGVLNIYPRQHEVIAKQISQHGALLCEVSPDEGVSARRLIARNRITSGLAKAVIVVEAKEDSGSMSTARRAFAQGRRVYAVAGDDGGCDALIEAGATALATHSIDTAKLAAEIHKLPVTMQPSTPSPGQPRLF